jgi:hypothetical protein
MSVATETTDTETEVEGGTGSFLDTWGTLVVVTIVMFVVSLDASMIPVAIEPISTDLRRARAGFRPRSPSTRWWTRRCC